ncbi:MAG: rhodanese-like domain-containing protein [Bdellovibrionales bacterium]|nr:rhodanese-like domain-containing protein [Bdellovibrionales bacterium]
MENILNNSTGFLFFDLSEKEFVNDQDDLKAVLEGCRRASARDIEKTFREMAVSTDQPIVLLCEDGKLSRKVARRLIKSKYTNVYVIAGGKPALIEYFQSSR